MAATPIRWGGFFCWKETLMKINALQFAGFLVGVSLITILFFGGTFNGGDVMFAVIAASIFARQK